MGMTRKLQSCNSFQVRSDALSAAGYAVFTAGSGRAAKIPVTCSIGCAASGDPSSEDVSALIQRADRALYRAKSSDRNRIEFEALPGTERTASQETIELF